MCQVTHRLTLNARAVYEMDDEQAPAPAKKKKKASSPAKKKGGGVGEPRPPPLRQGPLQLLPRPRLPRGPGRSDSFR